MAEPNTPLSIRRRRLDVAAKVLSRPFTTPLRPASVACNRGDSLTARVKTSSLDTRKQTTVADAVSTSQKFKRKSHGEVPMQTSKIARLDLAHADDPAQLSVSRLHIQIRTVRADIDTLQRALDVHTSDHAGKLAKLTEKWKGIAQAAADELYPAVKGRAETSQWPGRCEQSSYTGQQELPSSQDQDAEYRATESDKEIYQARHHYSDEFGARSPRHDCYSSSPAERTLQRDDAEGNFTMEQMLRSLNIDLDLIGFDIDLQQWIDR